MPEIPTRWIRVRELFDLAVDQPTDGREEFVRQAAGNDIGLGNEVLSLLGALDHAGDTLERSPSGALGSALGSRGEATMVGSRVGPYEIVRLIGYGGMGAVYEGVRADGDFAMRVAIKFLRPGLESDLAIRRFRYERQILASLSHRNIAGLFDGGVTPDGLPYFVMEFVDGDPITAYCAARGLNSAQRVALIRQVCSAVQHAHQQLVVHRDLKPGNILVTADGTVKLLDFGIAKLLREKEGPDQLPMTQGGIRAFTPEYASPEQVRGLPMAAASDVYSLGIVLYELLAGRRPFSFEGKLFAEIEQIICTTPPPRASWTAGNLGDATAAARRRDLAGDLDIIVQTALAKEPERRYGTADQLSADLRAWLDRRPISARKASIGYAVRKFLARHRIEVAASAVAIAALVGGVASTARQARVAERERLKTEQVNNFISTMLSAVDPGYEGRDVTVADVLNKAAGNVGKEELEPEVEAQIRHTIGQTYYGLGLYDSARTHAVRAFELRRQAYGERDPRTGLSLSYVVALAEARGAYAEAESLARVNVELFADADEPSPTEHANALDNLARTIELQGRLDEALQYKRSSITLRRQMTDSASRRDMTYTLNNLAVSHRYRGEYAAAESLVREALVIERELGGMRTPMYGDLLNSLAGVTEDREDYPGADSLYAQSIGVLRAVLGPDHPNTLRALANHARVRLQLGRPAEAATMAQAVVDRIGTALPEGDQTGPAVLQLLGTALDSLRRYEEGEAALKRSLELRRRFLPATHWAIASSETVLGAHYIEVGRYAEAERLLLGGYRRIAEARGASSQIALTVARRLTLLYERTRRPQEAGKWRSLGG
jgi:serine/threonine-protein kinase